MTNFKIDKTWSLFLDRDGVINQKLEDDYVKDFSQFVFMPHAKEVLPKLRLQFGFCFVVTNQQGIGKGLMNDNDLLKIHWQMQMELSDEVLIDQIYYCPDLVANQSPNRKPEIGMALQAKKDFPKIDLQKAVMIGDSLSDMEFGKKVGMKTIFFGNKEPKSLQNIDIRLADWQAVDEFLGQKIVCNF